MPGCKLSYNIGDRWLLSPVQLMALGEKNEMFQLEMHECSNQLSCATQLINTLLRYVGVAVVM